MLVYPNHKKPFHIETEASYFQWGAVIKQDNKRMAFYTLKLHPVQKNYTTNKKNCYPLLKLSNNSNWCFRVPRFLSTQTTIIWLTGSALSHHNMSFDGVSSSKKNITQPTIGLTRLLMSSVNSPLLLHLGFPLSTGHKWFFWQKSYYQAYGQWTFGDANVQNTETERQANGHISKLNTEYSFLFHPQFDPSGEHPQGNPVNKSYQNCLPQWWKYKTPFWKPLVGLLHQSPDLNKLSTTMV